MTYLHGKPAFLGLFLLPLFFSAYGSEINRTDSLPNYSQIFPQDRVNRIDIVISPQTWQKMLKDMESHFGKFGKGFMGPPPRFRRDSLLADEPEFMPPPMFGDSAQRPKGPPGPGNMPPMNHYSPDYVQCSLQFEGRHWTSVGIRFKGNSSLMSSWSRGIKKFPFRLEFGKYKKSAAKTNSFLGFHELSFSSNNDDKSLLREKITADIFREAGVKAPHTAFYRVFIDYGEGPQYFGLYTAVEIVDDTMLKDQFGNETGNCYKPEGPSASFSGTFNTNSFEKKTNKKSSDWSDVQQLFKTLNANVRVTNPSQWKNDLEAIFDVPSFLNWLAVNSVIQNWDTYGQMAHNYYLYNNPATHKFVWIPWDNNEALMRGKGRPSSLSLSEVSGQWPLIRYLLDQPDYNAMYKSFVKTFINNSFELNRINKKIDDYHNLIALYVIGAEGEKSKFTYLTSADDFDNAIAELKKHIEKRIQMASMYLEK